MKNVFSLHMRPGRRLATTVGDLVSAIYEVAPGHGSARLAAARAVLASRTLARRLSRPIALVAAEAGD